MPGTVDEWRSAQAAFLNESRKVVVFSCDAAKRLKRYMPDLVVNVEPPQADVELTADVGVLAKLQQNEVMHIALVGALGMQKGYDVLLGCARDAQRRALPLHFTLVGHTIDDQRLLNTDRVFITGRFQEGEAQELLREIAAHVGFVPSVWPETWCYALSELWLSQLQVIAFDIGSQASRIRSTGAGRLLPLHMSATNINDFFLRLRQ